ncbi:MAG: RidA family protein [bacterium]|nr:RidA family protein [bacterium]
MTEYLRPDGWKRPDGYSDGTKGSGDLVFVAGQIGWAKDGILAKGFVSQVRQALNNVVAVLESGGAGPEHVTRMTWYVVDIDEYRAARSDVGKVYSDVMGKHYPAMSLVEVNRLVENGARVEIEATAIVP